MYVCEKGFLVQMEVLRDILIEHYGVVASDIRLLEGYEDKTYLVESARGRSVLKVYSPSRGLATRLALETKFAEALAHALPYEFPVPIYSAQGNAWVSFGNKTVRLLPFLQGEFLAEVPKTDRTLRSLGAFLGQLTKVGASLSVDSVPSNESLWDLQHLLIHRGRADAIEDPKERALINYFLLQFEQVVEPRRFTLRKSLIHNDANDWNLLTQKGKVSGIIDFGDLCYSWLIAELAVALPYVMAGKEDPIGAACIVIAAYHREFPLLPEELHLLYYLVAGRICMSLCNSAAAKKLKPDSEYIQISEGAMRQLLHHWIACSPEAAWDQFARAAGIPIPKRAGAEEYLSRRNRLVPRSLSLSYHQPIVMQRAAFQYMFDNNGTRFLDAYNNIMLVGHCHPRVVQATSSVLGRINTNTRYHYEELLDYCQHLLGLFPDALSRVFLVNSGSAATDLALRLSMAYTGRKKMLALEHGYHGNTVAGISVSHYKHRKGEIYPDTLLCPMPKAFGSGLKDDGAAGLYYSSLCRDLLKAHPEPISAFIAEPIMGCGGQVPLAKGFLPEVYKLVRHQGGVCISDEVQVGFGRLGNWNWGYEKHGVVPDMVVLGKPMGNGHPMGAVVTTREIASVFDSGPEFFSSFGGNPVSCAAGNEVLHVLREEGLRAHARETGMYLKEGFRMLGARYQAVADVRGDGLFLGVELLDSEGNPATGLAQKLKNTLREAHILIGTDGPFENVLKIKPPLPFNRANCDELLSTTSRILKKLGDS
jgi:4-aminobutyrate aminotransferase-like enzyme/Ser/Thr protein kinase RdoA (MazF antagonist)